jgi:cytidylate kinase
LPGPDAPGPGTATLLARLRLAPRPVVLIDGGSGSGKTTFAEALAPALAAQLVRLDDFYPGWDGLESASAAVHDHVLAPESPGWRRWDWTIGAAAEWHALDVSIPLVIEGSGCLSRANRARATFGIWVELDTPTRKQRALDRDGEAYAPHWDRWAAQERGFGRREQPWRLADVVLDDDDVTRLVDGLASGV